MLDQETTVLEHDDAEAGNGFSTDRVEMSEAAFARHLQELTRLRKPLRTPIELLIQRAENMVDLWTGEQLSDKDATDVLHLRFGMREPSDFESEVA